MKYVQYFMWRPWRKPSAPKCLLLPEHITRRLQWQNKEAFIDMGTDVYVQQNLQRELVYHAITFIIDIQWSPCGKYLGVMENKYFFILNVQSKQERMIHHTLQNLRMLGLSWDATNALIAVPVHTGRINIFNHQGRLQNDVCFSSLIDRDITAFAVTHHKIAVSSRFNSQNKISVFDLQRFEVLYSFPIDGCVGKLHWMAGQLLVSPTFHHNVTVYRVIDNVPTLVFAMNFIGLVDDIEVLPTGKTRIATTSVVHGDFIYTLDNFNLKFKSRAVNNLISLVVPGVTEGVHYWRCSIEQRDFFTQ